MDGNQSKEEFRKLIPFLIKAILLYILWVVLYDYLIEPNGQTDNFLNYRVANEAALLLRIVGFHASTSPGVHQTLVLIDNNVMVGVGNPCNGLELFVLFAGFIIAFPGNIKFKFWFIPVGIVMIHLINALRTALLSFIQLRYPQYLDFNHHYTFTVIVYLFIFGLWMFWVNRISNYKLTDSEKMP